MSARVTGREKAMIEQIMRYIDVRLSNIERAIRAAQRAAEQHAVDMNSSDATVSLQRRVPGRSYRQ